MAEQHDFIADEKNRWREATPALGTGSPGAEPVPGAKAAPDVSVRSPGEHREIVKSATLVMLGSLASSVMGLVRNTSIAYLGRDFSGPFIAALSPAQRFNDLLINGATAGALIPTFNDYAAPEQRYAMRRLVYTVVNLLLIITFVSAIAFYFLAPWLFNSFLVSGFVAQNRLLTIQYGRIIFFSLCFLGPFYVMMSALYALKEFGWPALAPAAYHIGIIVGAAGGALIGTHYWGAYGMPFGVILGSLGEIALLLPGLRKQRFAYLFVLDLKHPAIRRILSLYAPIAGSYVVTAGIAFLDQHLASSAPCTAFMTAAHAHGCGEANVTAMNFATTLYQFPQGLVSMALSTAILPTLTAQAREGQLERFKDTLLLGFRLGLLLMIPAATGLILLRFPIASAIYQRGGFRLEDSLNVSLALQNYAYQLPFLVVDQLLIAAFYARKNTIIPVVVGVISVLGYLAVALPFWRSVGMPALAFANTVQNSLHAIILLFWLRHAIGHIKIRSILPTLLKIVLATAIMGLALWCVQVGLRALPGPLFSLDSFLGRVLTVFVAGGFGAAVYVGCVMLFRVEEVRMVKAIVRKKFAGK